MTEEVINKLPELFKDKLCTLKKASWDKSKKVSMCDSRIKVINFDNISKVYSKTKGLPSIPTSNDALYIDRNDKWYFIEFKNGSVDKSNIYRKLYDSLIILIELEIIPNIDFVRKNVHYILVYNSEKADVIPKSEGREENYKFFQRLSKSEVRLFDIDKFEKYLFEATHTYTKEEFLEKFVYPMEEQEKRAVV